MGGQCHAPAALPPRTTQYSFYRRLGEPQGQSGQVRKISTPPGFDPRTAQSVASRYTDCAIQPHGMSNGIIIFKFAEILKKAIVFGNSSGSVLGDTKTMGTQIETEVPTTIRRSSVVLFRQNVGGTEPLLWTGSCSAESQ